VFGTGNDEKVLVPVFQLNNVRTPPFLDNGAGPTLVFEMGLPFMLARINDYIDFIAYLIFH
jgi:hypothetical protein